MLEFNKFCFRTSFILICIKHLPINLQSNPNLLGDDTSLFSVIKDRNNTAEQPKINRPLNLSLLSKPKELLLVAKIKMLIVLQFILMILPLVKSLNKII